jgi:putative hydrolase of the HAD superfamily
MTPLAAVVFDLDETLVDHEGAVADGLAAWLGERADGAALLERWRELEGEHFGAYLAGRCSYLEQRRRRLRAFLPDAGLATPADDALDAAFEDYHRAYRASWRAFDDAERCLRGLAPQLRRAVLTNGDARQQRAKLVLTGLDGLAGELFASSALGVAKPAPDAFATVCARLGVAAEATAYVGDALETDALAACAAGLRGIWLDRAGLGLPCAPAQRIGTLDELPPLLA